MPKDVLLEIGTEEIPARFMPGILAQMENIAKEKLDELRIVYGEVRTFGTPRRVALIVREVADRQQDKQTEAKGPSVKIAFDKNGAPTKAAQGFARGQGVEVEQLIVKDDYVYAFVHETGQAVEQLLPSLFPELINSLTFPKNMRWGSLDMRFVRPIRWLLALFGKEVIPFSIAEVEAGRFTFGHRFLSKGKIEVQSVDDYFGKLAENHVMVDQDVRRRVIREQVEKIASSQGGVASIDEDLLEEVVFLVEYPTALCGKFEEKYLSLPPEAVVTPMREHQRYFPVVADSGKLLPVFITVRNGGSDYIDIVRHGNERVLKARLADAQFFFEEDKKLALAERVEKLKSIVFQEGLGSLYDKTIRIEKLALFIGNELQVDDAVAAVISRGAQLSKADLVTGMVCEFTELQGIMGKEYALLSGESEAVAQAIFEHYLPRFAGDSLPQHAAGQLIGVADKLDNIIATFSRGLIPTGSQDPYALRRQALGIVNILIDARYHLSLQAVSLYAMNLLGIAQDRQTELLAEIQDFFRLRIKNVLADKEVRYDIADAVIGAGTDDIYNTCLRAEALTPYCAQNDMAKLVQAFTRVGNLAKNATNVQVQPELFSNDAERRLFAAYTFAADTIAKLCQNSDYAAILAVLPDLVTPIDEFFSAVMVMDKNDAVRENRLALLKRISELPFMVADFNKIVL